MTARMRFADLAQAWLSLPLVAYESLFPDAPPLVVAPHPDDESLGCAGIIAAGCARGSPPSVAIVTDGAASHPGSRRWPALALRDLRASEARAAADALGLPPQRLHFLAVPDGAVPLAGATFEAAVAALRAIHVRDGCGAILSAWAEDPHPDHQASRAMARAAARQAGVACYEYPVWGWTLPQEAEIPDGWANGWRVAMGPHAARKQAAIAAHRSQTTGMIDDATEPWHLTSDMLAYFRQPFEVLLTGEVPP